MKCISKNTQQPSRLGASMREQNRKLKVMIARWFAHRIEMRTRRLRRSLRDYDRIQWRLIHAADRRARGLRLYAAWSFKQKAAEDCGIIVPLEPPLRVEQQANRKSA
jgi:hypothetical protein